MRHKRRAINLALNGRQRRAEIHRRQATELSALGSRARPSLSRSQTWFNGPPRGRSSCVSTNVLGTPRGRGGEGRRGSAQVSQASQPRPVLTIGALYHLSE